MKKEPYYNLQADYSYVLTKEVFTMATSSITKNFVISGKEQVEMFVNAIEESAKNRPVRTPVNVEFIETEDELREFMRFREKKAKEKLNANNG